MSGFVVDSRTLLAVRDTLGRLNDQLLGMHTVIWHQWGTLGGRALESELEHFCGTWHYGVTELGEQLQDLTRRLGEAAAAYERIEQRITQAGAGSTPTTATGAGHAGTALTGGAAHHAKHHAAAAHHAPAKHHAGSMASGGTHYSGGVGIAPAGAGSSALRRAQAPGRQALHRPQASRRRLWDHGDRRPASPADRITRAATTIRAAGPG